MLGPRIRHTQLIHLNLCEVLFLVEPLAAYLPQVWDPIITREAFADEANKREPDVQPEGRILLWMLAGETGRYDCKPEHPGDWVAAKREQRRVTPG